MTGNPPYLFIYSGGNLADFMHSCHRGPGISTIFEDTLYAQGGGGVVDSTVQWNPSIYSGHLQDKGKCPVFREGSSFQGLIYTKKVRLGLYKVSYNYEVGNV